MRVGCGSVFLILLAFLPDLQAHHEAIFGPQSATLISQKRFVSTQHHFTNRGRRPRPRSHAYIGTLSVATSFNDRWGVSVTLPFEVDQGHHTAHESATGVQDLTVGIRHTPRMMGNRSLMAVLTLEPPTGNLEHRAFGVGGGVLYGVEWGHWSVLAYGLGRTESSFDTGEKRGTRMFLGGGLAYESHGWPLSPQLGLSWEKMGRRWEGGTLVAESRTSVLMVHPTLARNISHNLQTFLVLSLPTIQDSGSEGWQRFRIAAGMVWRF